MTSNHFDIMLLNIKLVAESGCQSRWVKRKKSKMIRNDQELQLEEEIIQLEQKKTRAKIQFTKIKNQLLRMLESDAYDDREINIVREKLSTVEELTKMLIKLSDTYESNNNMEEVERTTDEMEKLNKEYSDTKQCVQVCLDALREENRSHYSRSSRKSRQSVKSIQSQRSKNIGEVMQQIAVFEKKEIEKQQR